MMNKLVGVAVIGLGAIAAGYFGYTKYYAGAQPNFSDVAYSEVSTRNVADIYLPEGATNAPLVISIHGGGFKLGDKSNAPGVAALVEAGYAVAAINYQLSDTTQWPGQLDDLKSALKFLRENAKTYGYNGEKIGSMGASAGGHLSSMMGIALSDDPVTRVQASVDWFGPILFDKMDEDIEATGVERATGRNDAADSPESILIGATVGESAELVWAASPLSFLEAANTDNIPPFLVMHGQKDTFIGAGQSQRLVDGLVEKGVSAELVLLPEGTHGGGDFDNTSTMQAVVKFFDQHLK